MGCGRWRRAELAFRVHAPGPCRLELSTRGRIRVRTGAVRSLPRTCLSFAHYTLSSLHAHHVAVTLRRRSAALRCRRSCQWDARQHRALVRVVRYLFVACGRPGHVLQTSPKPNPSSATSVPSVSADRYAWQFRNRRRVPTPTSHNGLGIAVPVAGGSSLVLAGM
jgi:hypothetical protein